MATNTSSSIIPDPTRQWRAAATARRAVCWSPAAARETSWTPALPHRGAPEWGAEALQTAYLPPQLPLLAAQWRLEGLTIPGVDARRVAARRRRYAALSPEAFAANPIGRAVDSPIGGVEKALQRLLSVDHRAPGAWRLMAQAAASARLALADYPRTIDFAIARSTPDARCATKAQQRRAFVELCSALDRALAYLLPGKGGRK